MSFATAGALIGAAGLAPLLLAGRRELRLAGFALWAGGSALLAVELLSSPAASIWHRLSAHPALAAIAILVALAALAVAIAAALRWPWAFAVVAVLLAPARIPLHVGGQTANLLLPLYVVVAVGAVASAVELARTPSRPPALGSMAAPISAFVGLSALSLLWDAQVAQGQVAMLFFYLPFAFLALRFAELPPLLAGVRACFLAQCGLALLFAAVAFWQRATHHIFWNPKILVGNDYRSFFRVNSLFWDASIYGRFMAVTIVLLAGVMLVRRATLPLLATIAVVLAGLYLAYSQSSWLALAAGAFVLAAAVWPRRLTIAVLVAAAVVAGAGLVVALHGNSANRVTSDRSGLVQAGWKVIRAHPAGGAGLGGFRRAAAAGTAHPFRTSGGVSHTTPVTVAAELGPAGVILYVWLLAAVVMAALRTGRSPRMRLVLLAALAAIFTSSLFYDAFFEDPATWILFGLIATVSRGVDEPGS